jgi:hypothetical protein
VVVVGDMVVAFVMVAPRQGMMRGYAAMAVMDLRHAIFMGVAAMLMAGSAVLAVQTLFALHAADLANRLLFLGLMKDEWISVSLFGQLAAASLMMLSMVLDVAAVLFVLSKMMLPAPAFGLVVLVFLMMFLRHGERSSLNRRDAKHSSYHGGV